MAKKALYARVSSQRQEDEQTVQSQLAELREAIAQSGEVDWDEFVDEGYSRDDLARPRLDRLRDLVSTGDVNHVFVQSPDRLASGAKLVILFEELTEAGCEVTFLKGDVADTPDGKLLLHMQGAIAEYEKTKISERTRRGKLYWARQGFLPVKIEPFGFRYIPRNDRSRATLEVNEDNAQVVRSIYRWFVEDGLTLRGIAARLTSQVVPTARGAAHWYPSVIRKILSNPAYRCELLYQQTERVKGENGRRTRTRLRPESDWIRIPVPRIVQDELWNGAQSKLQANKAVSKRNAKREYLLRGLLFCAECGSRLAGKARNQERFYRCNNVDKLVGSRVCNGSYISADRVEQAVWDTVSDSLRNPELLADQYRKQLEESSASNGFDLNKKQIVLGLKRVVLQENRMTDAYRNEAIELDRYKSEMNQLGERRKGLEKEQAELERQWATEQSRQSALGHLERFCGEVSSGLGNLTFEERQKLLRLIVERAVVNDNSVRVETIIPSDRQHTGLLRTRHPEASSESLTTECDCHVNGRLTISAERQWHG
ncbi:MAG: recombinase family protein [Chloroflexi bacterium]|nr:recombinase family protein [Chloroflexota bacterium]